MSRSIKVSDQVYNELLADMKPRESFSEVLERILRVYRTIKDVSDTLGPNHHLQKPPERLPRVG